MDANIQEFLNHLTAEKGSSENTVAAYRNDLNQFQDYVATELGGREGKLADGAWTELDRDDLINYILWLKEREYASATVARKVAAMKSFCGFLVRSGAVEENPAEELDSPKVKKQLPTTLTPEEKLLRAIFGEKASDVKDTSLRVDQGSQGTVIDVQVFTREGIVRDRRAQQIIDDELKRFRLDLNDQLRIVEADAFDRIEKLLIGKTANGGPQKLAKGSKIDKAYLASVDRFHWFDIRPADDEVASQLESIKNSL